MKLTIDRKIWLRGEGDKRSYLLRPGDGKMCCLGVYLEACGVDRDSLMEVRSPCMVLCDIPRKAQWSIRADQFERFDSKTTDKLMQINDKEWIEEPWDELPDGERYPESEREAEIVRLFSHEGIEVTFIN